MDNKKILIIDDELGANDYIVKPFCAEELIEKVEMILAKGVVL